MKKILVIEDGATDREILARLLSQEGYQTLIANNGADGLDLAREQSPDLILCGARLAKMDGYAVRKALGQDLFTDLIPFILISDQSDPFDIRRGMEAGADDTLSRPFSREELLAAVDARIKKRSSIEEHIQKKLNELRSSITLSLPHELLTPLSIILGYAELMSTGGPGLDVDRYQEMSRVIYGSAQRLLRTTQNFLLYSELEVIRCDPERLAEQKTSRIESARDTIMEIVWVKGLNDNFRERIETSVEDARLAISEPYLHKVIEELIDNACQYSPPHTPVRVEGFMDQAHRRYLISVVDNGRGISPEQIASIGGFIQFDRMKFVQPGSGLGLALVMKIIQIFDGDMEISSLPGRGTTVRLRIPLAELEKSAG